MIKNLIFDAYGTIISTGTGSIEATRQIFAPYPVSDTPERIYKQWKAIHKQNINQLTKFMSERDVFIQDLGMLFKMYHIHGDPNEEIQPMLSSLYNRHLFSETKEIIQKLSKSYNIVIGSTTDDAPLLQALANNALLIHPVFTSESLQCYKPSAIFYEKILSQMNWNAEECCFIGDSLDDDVMGPIAVGMHAIWVNRKHIPYTNLCPHSFSIVTSLYELPFLYDDHYCITMKRTNSFDKFRLLTE